MQLLRSRIAARVGGDVSFHYGRADSSKTTQPYIVITELNAQPPEYNTQKQQVEQILISLVIYADTDESATQICLDLEDELVNSGEAVFANGKIVQVFSNGINISEVPRRHPTSKIVWLGLLKLRFMVQRKVGS